MGRFLTAAGPVPPSSAALTEFYREEFVKHHRCLQRQREYFSERAITSVEGALMRIIAQMDQLSATDGAEETMAHLLRQFDVVTGLSASDDRLKVH